MYYWSHTDILVIARVVEISTYTNIVIKWGLLKSALLSLVNESMSDANDADVSIENESTASLRLLRWIGSAIIFKCWPSG